jgi:hypothetical protein
VASSPEASAVAAESRNDVQMDMPDDLASGGAIGQEQIDALALHLKL